jgi:two-component system, cell cycle sensor histidine kinase and response regulator CckA
MDLSTVIAAMKPRLHEMIGASIAFQLNLEREGLWVKADAGLIEKVVAELISNARDATPEGGTITVEASRVNVGSELVRRLLVAEVDFDLWGPASGGPYLPRGLPEGEYVRLLVRDTGIGMDDRTKHMAFEPFFTTKAVGKGNGLGLSSVYGIVKQSGGWIFAESELGRGACFEIYLPEVAAPVAD